MVKSVKKLNTSDKKVRTTKKSSPVRRTKQTKMVEKETVVTSKKYTNMFAAYRAFWTRGFTDWTGTSSRSEYWWTVLANLLIIGVLLGGYVWVGHAITFGTIGSAGIGILFMSTTALMVLYGIAAFVPSISMVLRRLHDGGFSSWWILLYPAAWLPYVGNVAAVLLFILMLMPTRVDGNPYHKNNK